MYAFKTSIRTRPYPITMAELSSWLCSEAINVEGTKKRTGTSELPVAFAMSRGQSPSLFNSCDEKNQFQYSNRGGGSQFRGNFRGGRNFGYRGNRKGNRGRVHNYGSNFIGQNREQYGNSVAIPTVCQICNRENHTAIDCWYRLDTSYQGHKGNPRAYYSSVTPISTAPAQWNIDSAATDHMTNDLENL